MLPFPTLSYGQNIRLSLSFFPPVGSILGREKVFTLPFPFCQEALSYTSSLAGFPETAKTPGDMFLLAQTLLKAEGAIQQYSDAPRSRTYRSRPIVRNKQPLKRHDLMKTQLLRRPTA